MVSTDWNEHFITTCYNSLLATGYLLLVEVWTDFTWNHLRNHTYMTSHRRGMGERFEVSPVFADSVAFKQYIYCPKINPDPHLRLIKETRIFSNSSAISPSSLIKRFS